MNMIVFGVAAAASRGVVVEGGGRVLEFVRLVVGLPPGALCMMVVVVLVLEVVANSY